MKKIFQKIKYSLLKITTGSILTSRRIPFIKAESGKEGPLIWLTGGVHGDEVGGIVVIQEIFKRLKNNPLLKGSICAFPLMNPMGFEISSRNITLSKEDLNRAFPGDKKGSLAERIAYKIFNTIIDSNPSLVLDLHNDWRKSIPYVLIDTPLMIKDKDLFNKIRDFAIQTGFVIIGEEKNLSKKENLERTLSGSLVSNKIPSLTLELGESDIVNEANVEYGINSIWNILSEIGMVKKADNQILYPLNKEFKNKILYYSQDPISPTSGIIRFKVKPGDIIEKNQPLAKIYNAFGKLQVTLKAEQTGILLGYSDSSVIYPGVAVLALGIMDSYSEN